MSNVRQIKFSNILRISSLTLLLNETFWVL